MVTGDLAGDVNAQTSTDIVKIVCVIYIYIYKRAHTTQTGDRRKCEFILAGELRAAKVCAPSPSKEPATKSGTWRYEQYWVGPVWIVDVIGTV